ncbi:DUF1501 domain-containing protein [Planctellipticum variicoloris]|uniref:DUF1501 domain-containing protein n=1 Tax=Planctellipticum variicoloris TaxID=3064265 RepID=UPI003014063F|nr:DUF1501 domain-containing protein [Planctomycetaceae bacterium SH412]
MTLHASRRDFLQAGSFAAAALMSGSQLRAEESAAPVSLGKAEHCVMVWLGGGAGQIDTWDPKQLGDPKGKKAGSYYPSIDTAISGAKVCEHLPECAKILDRFAPIRTLHHDVIDEHAAAVNRLHTGRPVSETVTYPSIGSVVSYRRGPADEGVPAYVLIGYPSTTRGPGFLGSQSGYLYLTDTESGPQGLSRPADLTPERVRRREALLAEVRGDYRRRASGNPLAQDYDRAVTELQRLSGPQFMQTFQLDREPAELRNRYGGEFGQRCLLTRRLLERGVRFVEVSHNLNFLNGTGWDVHNEGIEQQHRLIQELDQAVSALVVDLERCKMLDKTLILVATEFGRPAQFDGGGGRGHHGKCFSVVLAGGGLKTGQVIGETDELAMNPLSRPVSVPDLHATVYAAMGINPHEELYAGDRPVPITDGGQPIRELFA